MKTGDVKHWRAYVVGVAVGAMLRAIVIGAALAALIIVVINMLGL